jgi:hypothetical protein
MPAHYDGCGPFCKHDRSSANGPSVLAIESSSAPPLPDTLPMTRSYVRVIVVWIVTLLALYAFQEYFS